MSRYTEEEISAVCVGIVLTTILHAGFDLSKIEGWGVYVGIPMILFAAIRMYKITNPKNKKDE